jgi:hypothetical protein
MLWVSSFSELMPILLNVVIGVPQMLSNIQMILICVGVSCETLFLPGFIFACSENVADTNMTWDFADGYPSRAQYVLRTARNWLAVPPAA